jgi:LPS export ABC transporter protein LptC
MTICQVLLVSGMLSLLTMPLVATLYTLIGAAVVGVVPMTVYLLRHHSLMALWAIPYSVFYVAALAWIPVYAIFTVHKSGWLTRQIRPQARLRPWSAVTRFAPVYVTVGLVAVLMGSGASWLLTRQPAGTKLQQIASFQQYSDASQSGAGVNYVHNHEGDVPKWVLSAAHSSFDCEVGLINLEGVELVLYQKDGSCLRFRGDRAEYDPEDRSVTLLGNVRGVTNNGLTLATKSLSYSADERLLDTNDEVILSGPDFKAKGKGIVMDMVKNRTVIKRASSSRVTAVWGSRPAAGLNIVSTLDLVSSAPDTGGWAPKKNWPVCGLSLACG